MAGSDTVDGGDLKRVAEIIRDILRGRVTLTLAEVIRLVRFCMQVLDEEGVGC